MIFSIEMLFKILQMLMDKLIILLLLINIVILELLYLKKIINYGVDNIKELKIVHKLMILH